MSRLCLTLAENDLTVLENKLEFYSSQVGFLEVRLDFLEDPERLPELPDSETEFIATCRPVREGGCFQGSEATRLKILLRALEAGFEWVDLEHDVQNVETRFRGHRMIRSLHDFQGVPPDLDSVHGSLTRLPGNAVKIAGTVNSDSDLVRLLEFMERASLSPVRIILGMGGPGIVTRILGPFLGNGWTYVAEQQGRPVAPGQFSLSAARDLFQIDLWNSVPDLYGVIGAGDDTAGQVGVFNQLFQRFELAALCVPLSLVSFGEWLGYLQRSRLPWKGFALMSPSEGVQSAVAKFGAAGKCNTLVQREGRWTASEQDLNGRFREWTGIDADTLLAEAVEKGDRNGG